MFCLLFLWQTTNILIFLALLNNVIFCHQEETNWPLSEGKVLKEKFDDIFGSIGYVKMLEKIKKTRDEEVKKFKLLEKDVRFFEHLKKEAEVTRKELNEENAQIDIEKAKVKELETKIKVCCCILRFILCIIILIL